MTEEHRSEKPEEIQKSVKKIPTKEKKDLSDLVLPKDSKIGIDELKIRLGY